MVIMELVTLLRTDLKELAEPEEGQGLDER